jgi:hypothetical protein
MSGGGFHQCPAIAHVHVYAHVSYSEWEGQVHDILVAICDECD